MSRFEGIFDTLFTDLILSILVATEVYVLFKKSVKNCTLNVQNEGGWGDRTITPGACQFAKSQLSPKRAKNIVFGPKGLIMDQEGLKGNQEGLKIVVLDQ